MSLLMALACGSPSQLLAPVQLRDEALARELPAQATVLGSVHLDRLAESPLVRRWGGDEQAELGRLDAAFRARFGVSPSELDRAALACDQAGCTWLIEGALRDLDLDAVGAELAQADSPVRSVRALPVQEALLFRSTDGTPLRMQRISEDRVALGHGPAVRALPSAPSGQLEGLEGAIPEGELWLVLREPSLLVEQVQSYLSWRGTPDARRGSERVDQLWSQRPELVDELELVALSLSVAEPSTLALRARCWDVEGARRVHEALAPLLAAQALESTLDPGGRELLGSLELVVEDRSVELRTRDRFGVLEFLLEQVEAGP
jgi:hypothetical protein